MFYDPRGWLARARAAACCLLGFAYAGPFETSATIMLKGSRRAKCDSDWKTGGIRINLPTPPETKAMADSNAVAANRIRRLAAHLAIDVSGAKSDGEACPAPVRAAKATPILTEKKQERLKWNGWGYEDTKFTLNKDGDVVVTGGEFCDSCL